MRVSYFLVWILIAVASSTVFGCDHRKIMKCYDEIMNKKINKQIAVELTGHYTYLYLGQIFDRHTNHYPKVAKYLRAKSAEELSHAERFIQYQNQRGGTVEMGAPTYGVALYKEGACANVKTIPNAFKCAMELEAHVTRELTELHLQATDIKVADQATDCANENITDDDDLRLTQPVLVTCPLTEGGEDAVMSKWTLCHCESIKSVAYVELADMIAHEFLDHQVEDTKEIANHYHTLKRLESAGGAQGLGEYLFDKHLEL